MKKVTEQNIENFKQLKESGKTLKEISEITNFNPNTISKYLQNKPKNKWVLYVRCFSC
jgi:transcriptional regulator with XRE-family HTH domain